MKCCNRTCQNEIPEGGAIHVTLIDMDTYCDDVCAAFEKAYRLEDKKLAEKKSE